MPTKHHEDAAKHHDEASRHHRMAGKYASEGNHEKVSTHAQAAQGHHANAEESGRKDSKKYASKAGTMTEKEADE